MFIGLLLLVILLALSHKVFFGKYKKSDRLYSFIPIALGVGLFYAFSRKAKALGNINYTFGLPNNVHIYQGSLKARIPVTIDNASFQDASFSNLYLRLEHNNKPIGNLHVLPKVLLPKMQATVVPCEAVISIQSLLTAAGTKLLSGGKIPVKAVGTVKGEGINKYIDETFDLQVPSLSSLTDLVSNLFNKG